MKTKNAHFRVSDEEYATLEARAKRLELRSTSALISRILVFFAQLEEISNFWDELSERAKRAKMTPAQYMAIVARRDALPEKEHTYKGLEGASFVDESDI